MKFIDTSALVKPGAIKTSSKLYMLWLTSLKGYTVEHVIQHPKRLLLGKLIYERTWVLRQMN